MAHKKGMGSSKNGRDSNAKRLGVKVSDGQSILSGGIILKQRGTKVHPGVNVKRANDDSLFATNDGIVKFANKGKKRKIVSVIPNQL
tara:strand:+ start:73 stop:333 length:261 start_codon:yes stop_codon:yes gene_type:complete